MATLAIEPEKRNGHKKEKAKIAQVAEWRISPIASPYKREKGRNCRTLPKALVDKTRWINVIVSA
jgi:hypothetical protein